MKKGIQDRFKNLNKELKKDKGEKNE